MLYAWTQEYALANQDRAVADAFRPLRTHQRCWTNEWWTSQKWSPSNHYHNVCGTSRKHISEVKQNAHSDTLYCGNKILRTIKMTSNTRLTSGNLNKKRHVSLRTRFRVHIHSIVLWTSNNFFLEIGAISEI